MPHGYRAPVIGHVAELARVGPYPGTEVSPTGFLRAPMSSVEFMIAVDAQKWLPLIEHFRKASG